MKQMLIPSSSTEVKQGNTVKQGTIITIAWVWLLISNLLVINQTEAFWWQKNKTMVILKYEQEKINESTLIKTWLTTQQILNLKFIEANIILLKRQWELPSWFKIAIDKKIWHLDMWNKKIYAKIKKHSILNSELNMENYDNYVSALFLNNKTDDSWEELSYYKRVVYYIAWADWPNNSLHNWFYNYNKLVKELKEDNIWNRRKLLQMTLISISKQMNADKYYEDEKLDMYKNISLLNLLMAKDLFKWKIQFVRIVFTNSDKKTSKWVDELESFYITTSSNPVVNKFLNNDNDIKILIDLSFESAKNRITF